LLFFAFLGLLLRVLLRVLLPWQRLLLPPRTHQSLERQWQA